MLELHGWLLLLLLLLVHCHHWPVGSPSCTTAHHQPVVAVVLWGNDALPRHCEGRRRERRRGGGGGVRGGREEGRGRVKSHFMYKNH